MKAWKIITQLLALFFLVQGLNWIIDPRGAAASLGMPLLDGIGRSTQIGDFAAFFLSVGTMIAMGTYPGQAQWLYGGALLLGLAAIMRTMAALVHGADFAVMPITIETLCAVFLCVAVGKLRANAAEA
ncbi:MAG: hypothetical protein VCC00_03740 [Deltaproteobacteria bacterium]